MLTQHTALTMKGVVDHQSRISLPAVVHAEPQSVLVDGLGAPPLEHCLHQLSDLAPVREKDERGAK